MGCTFRCGASGGLAAPVPKDLAALIVTMAPVWRSAFTGGSSGVQLPVCAQAELIFGVPSMNRWRFAEKPEIAIRGLRENFHHPRDFGPGQCRDDNGRWRCSPRWFLNDPAQAPETPTELSFNITANVPSSARKHPQSRRGFPY